MNYDNRNIFQENMLYKRKNEVEEKQIKDGCNRIKSKVKELRRGYKNASDYGSNVRQWKNYSRIF